MLESAYLTRLGPEFAPKILDIWIETSSAEVKPPEFKVTEEDAVALFEPVPDLAMESVCGVFGSFDGDRLGGFISTSPFELDGAPCIEFMVSFRENHRVPGLAVNATRDLIARILSTTDFPVYTIVNPPNDRGKRFYTRAGFVHDRMVRMGGHGFELWRAFS